MKRNLMQVVAAPSKVASVLDWKKVSGSKILAVDIGSDRIGMAVASHPDSPNDDDNCVQTLEALPRQLEPSGDRKRCHLAKDVVNKFQAVVREHNVCGYVVSWPIQEEGRCGAPCGLTLHTLDCLMDQTESSSTMSRPLCLWNNAADTASSTANNSGSSDSHGGAGSIRHSASACDEWGRDPLYAQAAEPDKTLHIASETQYAHHACSSDAAAQVWNDFCQTHWPELFLEQQRMKLATTKL